MIRFGTLLQPLFELATLGRGDAMRWCRHEDMKDGVLPLDKLHRGHESYLTNVGKDGSRLIAHIVRERLVVVVAQERTTQ